MSLAEELVQITTKAKKPEEEKKQQAYDAKMDKMITSLSKFYPIIDRAIKSRAKYGKSYLYAKFQDHGEISKSIVTPTTGKDGTLYIPGVVEDYDHESINLASNILATHYEQEGLDTFVHEDIVEISWESDHGILVSEARKIALAARVENVKSAKILGTVISLDNSSCRIKNVVMHTIRLIYQDGSKGLITIRESDPFVSAIIDKLEN